MLQCNQLKYAAACPFPTVSTPDVSFRFLFAVCPGNDIGADGAKHLAEALKSNSTLLELKYALSPFPYCQRPVDVCVQRLFAVWLSPVSVLRAQSTLQMPSRAIRHCRS